MEIATRVFLLFSLLAGLIQLSLARHLFHAQTAVYSLGQQLQAVQSQQQAFEDLFNKLLSDFQSAHDKAAKESDPANKIPVLQKSILQTRARTSDMALKLIPNLNLSQCDCNISASTKTALSSSVTKLTNDISTLRNSINDLNSCSKVDFSKNESNRQLSAAQSMKGVLGSTCTNPKPKAVYQTNRNASNWTLGGTTAQQLAADYKKREKDNPGNVVDCPLETPFYIDSKCTGCTGTDKVFNMTSMTCTSCKEGTTLNSTTRTCETKKQYETNPDAPGLVSPTAPTDNPNVENCPIDTPYYNGTQCIKCTTSKPIFDASTKKCSLCKSGTYYIHKSYACGTCSSGQTYDSNTHSCNAVKPIYVTNLQASNLVGLNDSYDSIKQKQDQAKSSNPAIQACPIDQPFWNTKLCISCPETSPLFNLSSSVCVKCKTGSTYSPDSRQCVQTKVVYTSNLSNPNWVVNGQDPDKVYTQVKTALQDPNAKVCPANKQFFNGVTCVGCSVNMYYSFDDKKCVTCDSGQVFDINVHGCLQQAPANKYQTNPSDANLIYDGIPLRQYIDQYNANKAKYPSMEDCPSETPFFDGISCIKCSSTYPYFNMVAKMCQVCGSNSTYNPEVKQCQDPKGEIIEQGPTIEKMLAGIF